MVVSAAIGVRRRDLRAPTRFVEHHEPLLRAAIESRRAVEPPDALAPFFDRGALDVGQDAEVRLALELHEVRDLFLDAAMVRSLAVAQLGARTDLVDRGPLGLSHGPRAGRPSLRERFELGFDAPVVV